MNKGKRILLHYDNASIHKNPQVLNHLKNRNIKLIPHPPYSPDISPCDFFLFGALKNHLEGFSSTNYEEVRCKVGRYLKSIPKERLENVMEEWKRLKYGGDGRKGLVLGVLNIHRSKCFVSMFLKGNVCYFHATYVSYTQRTLWG